MNRDKTVWSDSDVMLSKFELCGTHSSIVNYVEMSEKISWFMEGTALGWDYIGSWYAKIRAFRRNGV